MKLAGAYINDDTYGRLVALAAANNRTLAGQCRHLFDRALRGELQVPDGPGTLPQPHEPMTQAVGLAAATPWQPSVPQAQAAPQQTLRAVPRVLAALKAGAMPGSPVNLQPAVNAALNPQTMANATLNAQPAASGGVNPRPMMTGAATATVSHGALRGYENVPVAGVGVVMVVPLVAGMMLSTPGSTPATGLSCPAGGAGAAGAGGGGGGHDDACLFQTKPMPMPNTNRNPNHARPCPQPTPSPLPHTAPRNAHEPQNAARRMPQ